MKTFIPLFPFLALAPGFLFYAGYAFVAFVSGTFSANKDLTHTLKEKNEFLELQLNQKDIEIAGLLHELRLRDKKNLEQSGIREGV